MVLTFREIQERTGVSHTTLQRYVTKGIIKSTKDKGTYLIDESELSKLPKPKIRRVHKADVFFNTDDTEQVQQPESFHIEQTPTTQLDLWAMFDRNSPLFMVIFSVIMIIASILKQYQNMPNLARILYDANCRERFESGFKELLDEVVA